MIDLEKLSSQLTMVLNQALKQGTVYEKNNKAKLFLRPSSFPYCPLSFFLGIPKSLSKGKHEPVLGRYFMNTGTLVHALLQEAIGSLDQDRLTFLRDWRCVDCDHVHQLRSRVEECEKCRSIHVKSEEPTVEDGILLGHIDDVLEYKGLVYPIDYKTTTLSSLTRKGYLPHMSNVYQLSAYANVLRRKGYNVGGMILIYIARDNPTKMKVVPLEVDFVKAEKDLKKWKRQHLAVLRGKELKHFIPLVEERHCRMPEDVEGYNKYCTYAKLCCGGDDAMIEKQVERSFQRCGDNLPLIKLIEE